MTHLIANTLRYLLIGIILLLSVEGNLQAQVPISIPKLTAQAGALFRIPVTVGDLSEKKVTGFEFVVSCDTNFVRILGVDQQTTLSSGLMIFANNRIRPFGPGKTKIVCAGAQPMRGSGVLVYITAVAQKRIGMSALKLSECLLNAGIPLSVCSDGSVKVIASHGRRAPRDSLERRVDVQR